MSYLNTKLV